MGTLQCPNFSLNASRSKHRCSNVFSATFHLKQIASRRSAYPSYVWPFLEIYLGNATQQEQGGPVSDGGVTLHSELVGCWSLLLDWIYAFKFVALQLKQLELKMRMRMLG